jgi:hypothetical protein
MNEAIITREWKHFLEEYPPKNTETYELKLVNLEKTKSFAFNRVAEHQIVGLMTSLEGLWLKIPDTAASNGFSSQKPFDVVYIKSLNSYVVVIFYQPRKFKKAIKIPIKTFIDLKNSWPRKSIKMEELEIQDEIVSVII